MNPQNLETARVYYSDGQVCAFNDEKLAYRIWLSLPRGILAAFRGKGDQRPVHAWDDADKP
jgi:hypothetical protein